MSDPPPGIGPGGQPLLPANPQMHPPGQHSPKTSVQAQGEANMLGLMESARVPHMAGMGGMQSQSLGMGAKMAWLTNQKYGSLGNLPAFATALTANKKQLQPKAAPQTTTTETLSPVSPIGVNVTKTGAQRQDGKYTPNRSTTGDSVGLSFNSKPDDYAEGQAAWVATSKYFKANLNKEPALRFSPLVLGRAATHDTEANFRS
jgi:hypothetical protein